MHQMQQLPVRADQPTSNGLWSQNPYADPNIPMPMVHLPADFSWVIPTAVGAVVETLQNTCQSGPVSTFAYNLFSQQAYRNPQFQAIALECVEYVVYHLKTAGALDLRAAVIEAARNYTRVAQASCLKHFPVLAQYCSPVALNDISNLLTQWASIKANMRQNTVPVQQALGHQMQAGMLSPAAPIAPPAGGGLFAHTSLVAQTADERGRGIYAHELPVADGLSEPEQPARPVAQPIGGAGTGAVVDWNSQGLSISNDVPEDFRLTPDAMASAEDGTVDIQGLDFDAISFGDTQSFTELDMPDLDSMDDTEEAGYPSKVVRTDGADRMIVLAPSAHVTAQLTVESLAEKKHEWIDDYIYAGGEGISSCLRVVKFMGNPDRPWDAFLAESLDDTHERYLLAPALLADTHVTRSAHQPNRELAYNPDTHMLFHGVQFGTLEPTYEFICRIEDSMRYINHEFDERLRQEEMNRTLERDNIQVNWQNSLLVEPRVAKADLEKDNEYLDQADKRTRDNGEGEYNFKLRSKPVILQGCPYDGTLENTLARIDRHRLGLSKPDPELVDVFEAYGSNVLTFAVRKDDLEELIPTLNVYRETPGCGEMVDFLEGYSELVGKDRFYNRLNDILTVRLNEVLFHNLGITRYSIQSYVDDYEEMRAILKGMGEMQHARFISFLDQSVKQLNLELTESTLRLSTQHSLVYVDRSIRAMGFHPLGSVKKAHAISISTHRDLYLAMKSVIDRTAPMNRGNHAPVYIAASDGRILQLHVSAWDQNYISVQILPSHDFH